jgi:hypothetical protein
MDSEIVLLDSLVSDTAIDVANPARSRSPSQNLPDWEVISRGLAIQRQAASSSGVV